MPLSTSIQTLQSTLGQAKVKTDSQSLETYSQDWCKEYTGSASCVIFPESSEDVISVVNWAKEHCIALVPSGGRTGLSGGATALSSEAVISTEKMANILSTNAAARTITCQAGVITSRIQEAADQLGLFFPVEFASQSSSQIGGNIATNVGGIHVVRYGNIRDWVLGLKVVTGEGKLIDLNGSLVKNRTGYDLCSLMIGSEGTLGIITEATLRLTSKPSDTIRVLCGLKSHLEALELLPRVRDQFSTMSAFEYFSRLGMEYVLKHSDLSDPFPEVFEHYVLIEIEVDTSETQSLIETAFFELLEEGLVPFVVVSQSSKQAKELLEIRERIGEILASHYVPHKNDISVPVADTAVFLTKLTELCQASYKDFDVVVFGHLGDGNFHINIVKPDDWDTKKFSEYCHNADNDLFALVRELSGSISAEHGVGLLKKDFLGYSRSAEEISIMKGIKSLFDPRGILNPGKIFDQ